MTRIQALVATLDDRLNPVVVKELRQAVNARFIVGVVHVFLLLMLSILGLFLMTARSLDSGGEPLGQYAFFWMLGVLLFVCVSCVPGFVAARLIAESASGELELMFSTGMAPAAVVRGKLVSGLVLVLLLFSLTTPFMTFTYLLRGIDPPTILIAVGLSLCCVAPVLQLAILIACLPVNRVVRVLLLVVSLVTMAYVVPTVAVVVPLQLMSYGGGSLIADARFWIAVASVGVVTAGLVAILYSWTAAAVSSPASNRARPVRLTMLAVWLVAGVVFTGLAAFQNEDFVLWWLYGSAVLLSLSMFAAVSERDELGPRVCREVPRGRIRRLLAFGVFSGSASGLGFAVGLQLATLAVSVLGSVAGWWRMDSMSGHAATAAAILLEMLTFSLAAFGLQRKVLGRRIQRRNTWIVAVLLMALGALLSAVFEILAFAGIQSVSDVTLWKVANVFAVTDPVARLAALYTHLAAVLVLLLIVRHRLWAQVGVFRPTISSGGV